MIEQLFGARMSPLKIGDFDVHRVIETEGPFAPVSMLLPGVDMHQWYRSAPRNAQDKETVSDMFRSQGD